MKNTIEIRYEAMGSASTCFVNREPLGVYSELLRFLGQPFWMWAAHAAAYFDAALGEEYALEFTGSPFGQRVARAVFEASQHCAQVTVHPLRPLSGIEARLAAMQALAQKYAISLPYCENVFAPGESLRLNALAILEKNKIVCVGAASEVADIPLQIKPADQFAVENDEGRFTVCMPEGWMTEFAYESVVETYALPYLRKACEILTYINISPRDQLILNSAAFDRPNYWADPLPTELGVGERMALNVAAYPEASEAHAYVVSDAPKVVSYEDGYLVGGQIGTANVRIIGSDNTVVVGGTITVRIKKNIERINIVAPFKVLGVGESSKLAVHTFPEGAEDENDLNFAVSNPDVAIVKKNGEVVAFRPGKCELRVSSRSQSASFTIVVKHKLSGVQLNPQELKITRGETEHIRCILIPEDALHGPFEWSLDNESVATLAPSPDRKSCAVHTVKSGACVVTCALEDGSVSAICRVSIVPPVTHNGLIAAAVVLTVFGMFGAFLIPLLAGIMKSFGGMVAGIFADFCLPASLVVSYIGRGIADAETKTFRNCLMLDWITLVVMVIIALMVMQPRR